LHIARHRVAEVKLQLPNAIDPEPVATLRSNAEQALRDLRATQPDGAGEALVATYSREAADLSQAISDLDGRATVRRSWQRMVLMLQRDMDPALSGVWDFMIGVVTWLISPLISVWEVIFGVDALDRTSLDDGKLAPGAGEARGIVYVYEFYAFAIAVVIDLMIVLMAVCVVVLRRSTLIGVEAHDGARIDEQVIESALSGVSREDPAIFSAIVQHFNLTGDTAYPVSISISQVGGASRRARVRRVFALLGTLVRKVAEDRYELRPAAQVYLQYLASDESHSVNSNPEDLGGKPA
jgi:hypothetical protein